MSGRDTLVSYCQNREEVVRQGRICEAGLRPSEQTLVASIFEIRYYFRLLVLGLGFCQLPPVLAGAQVSSTTDLSRICKTARCLVLAIRLLHRPGFAFALRPLRALRET